MKFSTNTTRYPSKELSAQSHEEAAWKTACSENRNEMQFSEIIGNPEAWEYIRNHQEEIRYSVPLFNFSHSLNIPTLSILFEKNFVQGTVCRKEIVFPQTGEKRVKYFVVMNADPNEAQVPVVAQSNPTYALNHPLLKTHLVPADHANSDGIFRKPGYIDCTGIIPLEREKILSDFISDSSILIGRLPEPLLQELFRVIIGSQIIEIEYQERIFKAGE